LKFDLDDCESQDAKFAFKPSY